MPVELTHEQRADPHLLESVAAVYADGGVVQVNPSPHGGTWAFCYVSQIGGRVFGQAGHVTPDEVELPWVSNNLTEVLALLLAFEGLPKGWTGPAYSDSLNAIRAVQHAGKVTNHVDRRPTWLPDPIWRRLYCVVRQLGPIEWTLLGGHPNRKELAAGVRKDGKPVSGHNVWCDERCKEQAAKVPQGVLS